MKSPRRSPKSREFDHEKLYCSSQAIRFPDSARNGSTGLSRRLPVKRIQPVTVRSCRAKAGLPFSMKTSRNSMLGTIGTWIADSWRGIYETVLNPIAAAGDDGHIAEAARSRALVIWLLGLTGSGKSSIVR